MNRTDRLLAIVLALQARGRLRAADLAAEFETSVRTIYRDLQALSEAGVPLIATPGQGYALMEGYFLPPLTFTADEATMLLLGSDVMAQSFDAEERAAAEAAGRKIGAALPPRVREDVATLRRALHFLSDRAAPPEEALARLRRAILARRAVHLRYHARGSGDGTEPTTRDVDPYALVHRNGSWYLTGHDHLRGQVRTFRLDRIEAITVLDRIFAQPAGSPLALRVEEPRTLEVRALFAPAVARWVREERHFFAVAEEEGPDGLLVTLRVRREEDVLRWLLGWGRHVRVLAPASLRRRLAAEGAALAAAHADAPVGEGTRDGSARPD